jgi:hypothetical protein
MLKASYWAIVIYVLLMIALAAATSGIYAARFGRTEMILTLVGAPVLGLVIFIVGIVRFRRNRWSAFGPLVVLGLGILAAQGTHRLAFQRRDAALLRALPEYERAFTAALGVSGAQQYIEPSSVPRAGGRCCVRIVASRDSGGGVTGSLVVSRNTVYRFQRTRPIEGVGTSVDSIAPSWWRVTN